MVTSSQIHGIDFPKKRVILLPEYGQGEEGNTELHNWVAWLYIRTEDIQMQGKNPVLK